ncbi:MAG: amidohydrolase [Phocaeicola sp.]
MYKSFCWIVVLLLIPSCKSTKEENPSVVFQNGVIYTCDELLPTAQAMVLKNEQILYVGSNEEASSYINKASKVIDLKGKCILPGFVESHSHPTTVGALNFDNLLFLHTTQNLESVLEMVKDYHANNPQIDCIVGFGYLLDALGLSPGETPTAKPLDAISEDIPIFLYDESLHSAWCNGKALEIAQIDEHTPDILPGVSYYVRYPNSQVPTGYLYEKAVFSVASHLPNNEEERLYTNIESVLKDYSAFGFTSIVDADNYFELGTKVLHRMAESKNLPFYYQKSCVADNSFSADLNVQNLEFFDKRYSVDNLFCNTYKLFADGTVELESASLLEPYSSSGAVVNPHYTKEEMLAHISASLQAGYSVHIHAIGDKAQQYALDAFYETKDIKPYVARTIAHNQVFEPQAVMKYGALKDNLFCQSTPSWAQTENGDPTLFKLGPIRFVHQFLLGDVAAQGGVLTFGSDYPANEWEEVNPFYQMYHAVKRGEGADHYLLPHSAGVTREQALKAYTINGARQMGIGHLTGSLKVGKTADFIVVDQDIMQVDLEKFKQTKVEQLFFRGERLY